MSSLYQKSKIKSIISSSINSDPDLKYYLNNEYVDRLIDLLIDGIANAIIDNNDYLKNEMDNKLNLL